MLAQFQDPIIFRYIMDCVDLEGYDNAPVNGTDFERLDFVLQMFREEFFDWQSGRYNHDPIKAFAEYLQGLPTSVGIHFYYHDIIRISKEWGRIPEDATEEQEQDACDDWFPLIARKFFKLRADVYTYKFVDKMPVPDKERHRHAYYDGDPCTRLNDKFWDTHKELFDHKYKYTMSRGKTPFPEEVHTAYNAFKQFMIREGKLSNRYAEKASLTN